MSENDITNMPDGDFDSFAGSLNQDGAKSEIDSLMAAVQKDPDHAYMHKENPTHKRLIGRVMQLRARVHSDDPDLRVFDKDGNELMGTVPLKIQQACDAALVEQAKKQDALAIEGEKLISELVELGFEGTELPDDLSEADIQIWKLQIMHAKEDYSGLLSSMSQMIRSTKGPSSIQNLFATFQDAAIDLDPSLKSDLSQRLIEHFSEANQYSKQNKTNLTFGGRKK